MKQANIREQGGITVPNHRETKSTIDFKKITGLLVVSTLLLSACTPAATAATVEAPATKSAPPRVKVESYSSNPTWTEMIQAALEKDTAKEAADTFLYYGSFPRISPQPVFVEFDPNGSIGKIYRDPGKKEMVADLTSYNSGDTRLFVKVKDGVQDQDIVLGTMQRDEWEGLPVFLTPNGPDAPISFLTYRFDQRGNFWETVFAVLKPGLPIQTLYNDNGQIKIENPYQN